MPALQGLDHPSCDTQSGSSPSSPFSPHVPSDLPSTTFCATGSTPESERTHRSDEKEVPTLCDWWISRLSASTSLRRQRSSGRHQCHRFWENSALASTQRSSLLVWFHHLAPISAASAGLLRNGPLHPVYRASLCSFRARTAVSSTLVRTSDWLYRRVRKWGRNGTIFEGICASYVEACTVCACRTWPSTRALH